ncbi:Choline-phosphate cytidylyltransferase [Aphelenchoides besseyi]|nr:Choline-phosphate cytidylyltransferase [Aphelenchoides besseyi]
MGKRKSEKPKFADVIFSDELKAKGLLQKADFGNWQPRTLTEILQKKDHLSGRVVRIYADGVYDLFHFGHSEQFRQIKELIPNSHLIVGVCSDQDTLLYKKGATVMKEFERWSAVSHCRYVDEVHKSPPFFPTLEFIDSLKVDLVAHDDIPYPVGGQIDDCYAPFKEHGRFLETQRTPSISTTDLIQRIVADFEVYQQRQLVRLGSVNKLQGK